MAYAHPAFANSTSANATGCKDFQIIFARGSGQTLSDADFRAFETAVDAKFKTAPFSYDFYELGSKTVASYQYPAFDANHIGSILGAKISGGTAFSYGDSVKQGTNELSAYLTEHSAACPGTRYFLAGYSQGAQVLSGSLASLRSDRILYAATFGDPKLYLPEGAPVQGRIPACYHENLSDYRVDVPDCRVSEGVLGGIVPYEPAKFATKLGAWCNYADFMCGSIFDFSDLFSGHLSYQSNASYAAFADAAYEKALANYQPATKPDKPTDLALVLDNTGRMYYILQNYATDLARLARETIDGGGAVSVYGYCDEFSESPSFRSYGLSKNYASVVTDLAKGYQCFESSGAEASALSALRENLQYQVWSENTNRSILLLTDSPFFDPDVDGSTVETIINLANAKNVHVSVITTSELATHYFRLADDTGGTVSTALDTDISKHVATLASFEATEIVEAATGSFRFSLTPDDNYSPYTFVAIDDAPLGLTDQLDLEFTDLAPGAKITLTRIGKSGRPASPLTLTHDPSVPTGLGSVTGIHIKAPNSGG